MVGDIGNLDRVRIHLYVRVAMRLETFSLGGHIQEGEEDKSSEK